MSIFSNKIYIIIGHWFIVTGWLNEGNVLENIPIYENNIGTFLYFIFYDENYLNDGEHWHLGIEPETIALQPWVIPSLRKKKDLVSLLN